MPIPGKRWYHVTIGTHNSWLPGDPRGFRSRNHKIHSSGDHRNPPPVGEHAGLHAYSKSISGNARLLPVECREIVSRKIRKTLENHFVQTLIISVGGMHVHLLAELPSDRKEAKRLIGIGKKSASQALSQQLPGRIWARDCGLKPILDEIHHRNTFQYILRHKEEGAYVWTFRDPFSSED